MSKRSGRRKKTHEVRRQRGIVRDQRGQDQPASKEDAQRSSGDIRPDVTRGKRKSERGNTAVEPSDPNTCEREAHLRVLADQLLFVVEKNGQLFTLKRTADVSEPICKQDLNLAQAEELLRTWKLRGFHGG
jgi:hypothetical protein